MTETIYNTYQQIKTNKPEYREALSKLIPSSKVTKLVETANAALNIIKQKYETNLNLEEINCLMYSTVLIITKQLCGKPANRQKEVTKPKWQENIGNRIQIKRKDLSRLSVSAFAKNSNKNDEKIKYKKVIKKYKIQNDHDLANTRESLK